VTVPYFPYIFCQHSGDEQVKESYHWCMHNTFLSNITRCVNWNGFFLAVNQPSMHVDLTTHQTMKNFSHTYGYELVTDWLTRRGTWGITLYSTWDRTCLLWTWLMKFGGNRSNRSCRLPVFSCLVLSNLVCSHYHWQWGEIGMKIMYPTHLHNIYSESNYCIVPKFYTRWQQRSRKNRHRKIAYQCSLLITMQQY